MKSNQVMVRKMGQFDVLQRTSDGFFDVNDLLHKINKTSVSHHFSEIIRSVKLQKYISLLYREYGCPIEIIKTGNTRNGRMKDEIWVSPHLLIEIFRLFDIEAYSVIKNELIKSGELKNEVVAEIKRGEIECLSALAKALKATKSKTIYKMQYPCYNGKYRIDMLLQDEYVKAYENAPHETIRYYTIIEYDEKHHKEIKNQIQDENRERDICKFLRECAINDGVIADISILRVKEEDDGYFYAYAIPFFTKLDTSWAQDKMAELMDFRTVYSEEPEIEIDFFNLSKE